MNKIKVTRSFLSNRTIPLANEYTIEFNKVVNGEMLLWKGKDYQHLYGQLGKGRALCAMINRRWLVTNFNL